MLTFDPRTISTQVYENLNSQKGNTKDKKRQEQQKSQAVELYTYIATWGLLRLRAEENALPEKTQQGKIDIIKCFFQTLDRVAALEKKSKPNHLGTSVTEGLDYLTKLSSSEYLGLTGLALQVAREFSFWAEAIYPKKDTEKK